MGLIEDMAHSNNLTKEQKESLRKQWQKIPPRFFNYSLRTYFENLAEKAEASSIDCAIEFFLLAGAKVYAKSYFKETRQHMGR